MKIVFFCSLGLLLLFVLLFLPFKVKANVVLNAGDRSLYYSLASKFFRLACGKIYLLDDFNVSKITNTSKLLKSDDPTKEKLLFLKILFSKVAVNEVVFSLDGGIKDDAFLTSILIGGFITTLNSLLPNVIGKDTNCIIEALPLYDKNGLNVSGRTIVKTNAFNILFSLICAKNIYKKENCNYAKT